MFDPFGILIDRAEGALKSLEITRGLLKETLDGDYTPSVVSLGDEITTGIRTDRVFLNCYDNNRFDLTITDVCGDPILTVEGIRSDD